MTFYEEISDLQSRIARAHVERDTWRASGMQEKYLEAHSTVDALELQLEALRQQGLRATARNEPANDAAIPAAMEEPPADREGLMAEFAITFNGRQYQYDRYRYDRLNDAVEYAKLRRSAPSPHDGGMAMPAVQMVQSPDGAQRQLMRSLAITFDEGVYHLGAYRYDRLADAINYARLLRGEAP